MLGLSIGSCMLSLRLSIGSCLLRLRLRLSFRGSGGQSVSCHVGSVSFRVMADPCQAAPVSCCVKSGPRACLAARAVSHGGVSACPCHVGATLTYADICMNELKCAPRE